MSLAALFLSFRERIRRRDAWVALGGLAVAALFAASLLAPLLAGRLASLALTVALAWPVAAIFAKRLHDRGKAPWPWLAFYLGPAILLTVLQQLGIGYLWSGGIAYPMTILDGVLPDLAARTLPNLLSFLALGTGLAGLFDTLFLPPQPGRNAYGQDPRILVRGR